MTPFFSGESSPNKNDVNLVGIVGISVKPLFKATRLDVGCFRHPLFSTKMDDIQKNPVINGVTKILPSKTYLFSAIYNYTPSLINIIIFTSYRVVISLHLYADRGPPIVNNGSLFMASG